MSLTQKRPFPLSQPALTISHLGRRSQVAPFSPSVIDFAKGAVETLNCLVED